MNLKNTNNGIKRLRKREVQVQDVFVAVTLIGLVTAFLSLFISRGENWKYLIWNGETYGIFPDLFESIGHSLTGDPYSFSAIYPPLSYVIFAVMGLLINTPGATFFDMSVLPSAVLIGTIFFSGLMILVVAVSRKYSENISKALFSVVMLLFIFSSPVFFMLERGNTVILCLLFLMLFCLGYESENRVLRYLSYVCLAVAASLKIYPAIFGLLLINKKRVREIPLLLLLGVSFFIIPFFMFGGLHDIVRMFENAFSLNDRTIDGTTGFGCAFKICISNVFTIIETYTETDHILLSKVITYAIALLMMISAIVIPDKWKKITCLSLALVFCPAFSFIYNGIYFLPCLLLFLSEEAREKVKISNLVYVLLFIGIFIPLPYGALFPECSGMNYAVPLSTLACIVSMTIFVALFSFECFKRLCLKRK